MSDRFSSSVLFKFPSPPVLQLNLEIRLIVDIPTSINLRFSKQLCKVYMNHLIRHDGRQPPFSMALGGLRQGKCAGWTLLAIRKLGPGKWQRVELNIAGGQSGHKSQDWHILGQANHYIYTVWTKHFNTKRHETNVTTLIQKYTIIL